MSTTPKLDEFLEATGDSLLGYALIELRDLLRAQAEPIGACIGDGLMPIPGWRPKEPAQATRYPSEIETRLIELVEEADMHIDTFANSDTIRKKLAAIKRDLGLDV